MTHPSAKPARRRNADYRWTLPKAMAFLAALAECGKIAEAARRVGMSPKSAFRLRKRIEGTPLAHGWELALRKGMVTRRQAREGRWDDGGLGELIRTAQGHGFEEQGPGFVSQGHGFTAQGPDSAPQGPGLTPEPCQTRQPPFGEGPGEAIMPPGNRGGTIR